MYAFISRAAIINHTEWLVYYLTIVRVRSRKQEGNLHKQVLCDVEVYVCIEV